MKIAIVVHRLSKNRGGAEGWTTGLIQWLSRQQHSVHLVSSHPPTTELAEFIDRLTLYPQQDRFGFSRMVSTQFECNSMDIVHDMGYGYRSDLFQPHSGSQLALDRARAQTACGIRRLRYRFLRRFGLRQRKLSALTERQFCQPTSTFLAVSNKVATDIALLHNVPRKRIRVVHNGVDIHQFSPAACETLRKETRVKLQVTGGAVVLVCVAHNHQLKGVPQLRKALQSEQLTNIHLVVVGGHRQKPKEQQVNGNRISYTGPCDDVLPYYAAADAFVLPTHYDACSLTVLEAMACGLPVITTLANGASELIEDRVDGWLLNSSTDTRELLASIEACRCQATRNFLGHNARRTALQHALDDNFAAIERIYFQIASPKRAAA